MTIGKRKKLGKKASEALAKGVFSVHKSKVKLTSGEMLRITRELQGLTQAELAELAGMTQATISSLENDRQTLGVERAKALARALRVHPGVLAFPDWDIEKETA